MRYAPDVRIDPYYIPCEPETRSAVYLPLISCASVDGLFEEVQHFSAGSTHTDDATAVLITSR
ncbi:MAG TPA: hypothetical protein VN734_07575 [Acidobacteriaceae bacterium]|nr:hypothetical protein [Acidobacteriaceae bacterium]